MNQNHSRAHPDIHAYIDGELMGEERIEFERVLQQDKALQDEVCELRKIKQQMLEHYQRVPIPKRKEPVPTSFNARWAVAASFFAAFGLGLLVSSDVLWEPQASSKSILTAANTSQKLLLHIDSSQPEKTQALLQKTSALLQAQSVRSGMPKMQIEIVANDQGIELFEQGNPSREAIVKLLSQYDNLKLIACQRALKRRADKGNPAMMIDGVETDKPALDEIVSKMQKGWGYYKF